MFWIWEGFNYLNGSRCSGYSGPQPISITDIKSYCDLKGITESHRIDLFLAMVSKMDSVFLADFYKKQEDERKRAERKKPQQRPRGR